MSVQLADILGDAVRGNGLRLHGFGFGQSGRLAISRRRSGQDHALNFHFLGRDQNVERPIDVDAVRLNGVFHRARHGSAGSEVQDILGFVHGLPHDLDVRDAAFDESNLVADFGEVVFLAR